MKARQHMFKVLGLVIDFVMVLLYCEKYFDMRPSLCELHILWILLCLELFAQVHLGDTPHNLTESDFESLARRTDGFSGSDISVCVSTLPLQSFIYFFPLSQWLCG
jgi:hypothetical protein